MPTRSPPTPCPPLAQGSSVPDYVDRRPEYVPRGCAGPVDCRQSSAAEVPDPPPATTSSSASASDSQSPADVELPVAVPAAEVVSSIASASSRPTLESSAPAVDPSAIASAVIASMRDSADSAGGSLYAVDVTVEHGGGRTRVQALHQSGPVDLGLPRRDHAEVFRALEGSPDQVRGEEILETLARNRHRPQGLGDALGDYRELLASLARRHVLEREKLHREVLLGRDLRQDLQVARLALEDAEAYISYLESRPSEPRLTRAEFLFVTRGVEEF